MRKLGAILSLALAVALVPGTAVQGQAFDTDFAARLTGGQEVPPVQTDASGRAAFDLFMSGGEGRMRYGIQVFDIENVVAAHIHAGCPGENGPIVVTLFSGGPTGPVDGRLVTGEFGSEDFEGPLEGQGMAALVRLIQSGCAYVNVHTTQNPGGEIRGQMRQVSEIP